MGLRNRKLTPGGAYHVYNRGLSRRPVFADDRDKRAFLALVRQQVEAGRIAVHAYCLLDNHFHLIVTSIDGELDRAVADVLRNFTRRMNRKLDRDGPLFRSRFQSKWLKTERYLFDAIAYVHRNPVSARLARRPAEYRDSSAWHFAGRVIPSWLTRLGHDARDDPAWVIAERDELYAAMLRTHAESSPLDREWTSSAERAAFVQRWLDERAYAADGRSRRVPIAAASSVSRIVQASAEEERFVLETGGGAVDAWPIVEAGLLRDLAALELCEIASRSRVSIATAGRRARRFRQLLTSDSAFAERVHGIARHAVWAVASRTRSAAHRGSAPLSSALRADAAGGGGGEGS